MWINNELFIEKEIVKLHPASLEYKEYWKEQKRRCIEGYWVGGKWMPGNLYFYINFWTILLNKTSASTAKSKGRPLLWDIFWEVAYNWVEARGMAGFEKQPEIITLENTLYTFDENPELVSDEDILKARQAVPNVRDFMRNTTVNLGKPKYLNEAQNLIWMANRGCGKSYFAAGGVIAHEYIFDGLKDYTLASITDPPKTEVLVGAGDTKYSTDLLKKVLLGIENLPGGIEINGKFYPCPFFKQSRGSLLQSGSVLEHRYSKKVGGAWKHDCGSGSFIKHVTYKDNPFAGQGTRPAVAVKEEIGMFDTLEASVEADVETQMDGTRKFGSTLLMGTGGDMEGGTQSAHKIFYAPRTYSCLAFDDTWEHKGQIGYFTPSTHGKRQYKDKNGNTREEFALKAELDLREKKRQGKNASSALDAHIQYNPLKPSEVFLTKTGNIFPKKELSDWLAVVENTPKYENSAFIGDLVMDEEGAVQWKPEHDLPYDTNPIRDFPVDTKRDDIEGCIVIWEHPTKDENGNTPYGLYLAGTDPYDHDESGTPSLGSTFIYKRFYTLGEWHNTIVAEYTGRPKAEDYYKKLINLLLYYNARCLYENEKKGLHQYMELKGYEWLLIDQPGYIKDVVQDSKVQRVKGMHMSTPLKTHGEILLKNWLEEEYAPGKLNLTKIRSVPLLKELISYNRDGNFDRAMAMLVLMYAVRETSKIELNHADRSTSVQDSDFFNRPKFQRIAISGGALFR
jgi:hypothetical protein